MDEILLKSDIIASRGNDIIMQREREQELEKEIIC